MAKNLITGEEILNYNYNGLPTNNQTIGQGTVQNNDLFPIYSPNIGGVAQTTPAYLANNPVTTSNTNTATYAGGGNSVSGGQVSNSSPSSVYNNNTNYNNLLEWLRKNNTTTTNTPKTTTGSYVATETPEEKKLREAEEAAVNPFIDEESIRKSQMDMFQKEIDALNAVYAIQKQEATQRGLGRLGSDAAIQARRGLLGSSFGGAQTESVTGVNTQEQNAIDAEKSAKIATIMGTMRKSVADEITAKREAAQKGADSLVTYLKGNLDRKEKRTSSAIKAMIDAGVDMTDEDFTQVAKELGVDVSVVKNQYVSAKKESDTAIEKAKRDDEVIQSKLDTELAARNKSGADILKPFAAGGYIYQYNPQTGDFTQIQEARSTANTTTTEGDKISQAKADLYQTITENPGISIKELAPKFPELKITDIQEILDTVE